MIQFLIKLLSKLFFFTGRLGKKNGFDSALTPEEERCLFTEYMKTNSKEIEEKLTRCNLRLVAHIASKYKKNYDDEDDLISVGSIGLIKAIRTYDMDKTKSFSSYASRCIENEILMLLRSEKKHQADVSIEGSIGVDKDGNEVALIDILESIDESVEHKGEVASEFGKLKRVIQTKLSPREREIIAHRFGLFGLTPKTQNELAEIMNISRSYISRIEKKALETLKKYM